MTAPTEPKHDVPELLRSTAPKKSNGRRSKNSKRPRGGVYIREAGRDTFLADTRRLRAKWIQRGELFRTQSYSINLNGAHVSTGWQGLNPPPLARSQIRRSYSNNSILDTVAKFFPVPADL
jgi:hypothetical protein